MRLLALPVGALLAVAIAGILLASSPPPPSQGRRDHALGEGRPLRRGCGPLPSPLPMDRAGASGAAVLSQRRCRHLYRHTAPCGPLGRLRGGDEGEEGQSAPAEEPVEEIKTEGADPQAAEAAKVKGNDAYKRRDFPKAIERYTEAIQLDPENPVYLNNRAAVYLAQDNLDDAEVDVRKAIQLEKCKPMVDQDDKALGRSYLRMGSIHHKRGNFSGAIYWFKNSIVEHTFPETSMKLRESEKALKEQKAKEYINPELSAEAKQRGNKLFRDGDIQGALVEYTEAIKRNPEDPKAWNNRAACHQKLYELREGINDAEKAVKLDPKYVKGWSRLGQMYFGNQQLDKSKQAFEKMNELEPGNEDAKKGIDMVNRALQNTGGGGQGATQAEVEQRVRSDPEAIQILSDPAVQQVLKDLQANPGSAQQYMQDAVMGPKLKKLIDIGVIQTSRRA